MDYSEIIYFISQNQEKDEIGNVSFSSSTSRKCYAKKQSVKTSEYYNAVSVGLNPSIEFVVKKRNYCGETEIKWNDEIYSIVRTVDPKNKYDIVLVCSKKIGKK